MIAHLVVVLAAALTAGSFATPSVVQVGAPVVRAADVVVEEHGAPIPGGDAITPSYTITPEGGGSWSYGTNGANNTAYSNFYHKTRKHGSSVENGAGNLSRSKDTAGGATAKSSIRKTYAGNHAYYRFVG